MSLPAPENAQHDSAIHCDSFQTGNWKTFVYVYVCMNALCAYTNSQLVSWVDMLIFLFHGCELTAS